MNRMQHGFTLIELVLVIVILGILAATALPRFVDLSSNAEAAKANGALAALKSGAALAHAEMLAVGASSGQPITMEGQTVNMVNGYPTADDLGITVAAGVSSSDGFVPSGGGASGGSTLTFTIGSNVLCIASYTSPAAVGDLPLYSSQVSSTDCQ